MLRRIKFKRYNYLGREANDPFERLTSGQTDEKRKLVHEKNKEGINTHASTRRLRRSKHRKRIIKR